MDSRRAIVTAALVAACVWPAVAQDPPADAPKPTFRSSVDLVSVAAVVRDRRGQVVRDLRRDDFLVYDNGVRRPILEFTPSDDGPVSLALLVDISGSMVMAGRLDQARAHVGILLDRLRPGVDEVALYTFDSRLHEERGFGDAGADVRSALDRLTPFGATSLYDAIGDMARRLETRVNKRRAILVVTDGLDNNSRLSPGEVSGLASATDVPVYVMATLSPVDHAATRREAGSMIPTGQLANLAAWTGGTSFIVSTPAHASVATDRILADLRHQYLLAFEGVGSGWRPLDVRVRKQELTVRARSGYFVAAPVG